MSEAITICLTGLSGAGKTTLANEICKYLLSIGRKAYILDGDYTRKQLGNIFGYTREERMKMSSVNRLLANTLNSNEIDVIMAIIAPYKEMRNINRKEIKNYFEMYLECSLETCVNRDVKGLYKKSFNKEINDMIGIDNIYEISDNYDLIVNTETNNIKNSMLIIEEFLKNII